jgi:hypothetical protein
MTLALETIRCCGVTRLTARIRRSGLIVRANARRVDYLALLTRIRRLTTIALFLRVREGRSDVFAVSLLTDHPLSAWVSPLLLGTRNPD